MAHIVLKLAKENGGEEDANTDLPMVIIRNVIDTVTLGALLDNLKNTNIGLCHI